MSACHPLLGYKEAKQTNHEIQKWNWIISTLVYSKCAHNCEVAVRDIAITFIMPNFGDVRPLDSCELTCQAA